MQISSSPSRLAELAPALGSRSDAELRGLARLIDRLTSSLSPHAWTALAAAGTDAGARDDASPRLELVVPPRRSTEQAEYDARARAVIAHAFSPGGGFADSIGVATLCGVTPEDVNAWIAADAVLAVTYEGHVRIPLRQFVRRGDGVLAPHPAVPSILRGLRSLGKGPLAMLLWLTSPEQVPGAGARTVLDLLADAPTTTELPLLVWAIDWLATPHDEGAPLAGRAAAGEPAA